MMTGFQQLCFFSWRRSKSECMQNSKLHDHAYPLHSLHFSIKPWTKWLQIPRITDGLLYFEHIWTFLVVLIRSEFYMLGGGVLWYVVIFSTTSKECVGPVQIHECGLSVRSQEETAAKENDIRKAEQAREKARELLWIFSKNCSS